MYNTYTVYVYVEKGEKKFVTDLYVLPGNNTIICNETRAQPPELGGLCFFFFCFGSHTIGNELLLCYADRERSPSVPVHIMRVYSCVYDLLRGSRHSGLKKFE